MEQFMASLHEDLIFEILQRVKCVKSIGRYRCVSKACRSLLSTSEFIKSHTQKFHIHGPKKWFFFKFSPCVGTLTTLSGSDDKHVITDKFKFPYFNPDLHRGMHGSCHGLVLFGRYGCAEEGATLVLLNSITKDGVKIPPLPNYYSNDDDDGYGHEYGYGLGYDSCTDDYKIVSIRKSVLRVYSVKTRRWRTVQNTSPYRYLIDPSNQRIFVDGRLYFVSPGAGDSTIIAAFNLGTEEFESVPYPKGFDCQIHFSLLDLGGCLAIWDSLRPPHQVWLMKGRGVQDSWIKFTINRPRNSLLLPNGILDCGDDEFVLLEMASAKFISYNRRSGVYKDGTIDMYLFESGIGFRESLISPTYS